ncbi:hypothetical protein VU05_02365 [Desulfobulbus sp. F1]|nr:hypothetical protein [Desulfobulbus sp. F1]
MQNSDWLFSGIAISIPVSIIGWCLSRKNKKPPQKSKNECKNKQLQTSGDNCQNTQISGNQIIASEGSNVHVAVDEKEKLSFYKDNIKSSLGIICIIIAFISNPDSEAHLNKISSSPVASRNLNQDLFYENLFILSYVYMGHGGNQVVLTWGIFGQVIENSNYFSN